MKGWKWILLFLALGLGCVGSCVAGSVLRVGINASYAPFETVDDRGRLSGFDIDLVTAWAQNQGVTVKLVNLPWTQLLTALHDGRVDMVVSAVAVTAERQAQFDFSRPYFHEPQVLLLPRQARLLPPRQWTSIGVLADSSSLGWLRRLGVPAAAMHPYPGLPPMLADLQSGSLQGVFGDLHALRRAAAQDPSLRLVSDAAFGQDGYAFVVRKGAQALLAQANRGLNALETSGKLAQLRRAYPGL